MIEPDRVLRPVQEAAGAIDQLDSYESPAVLTEALRATWSAVDRSLRILLRSDATAPESIRLTALSAEQMSTDGVIQELRRRNLISLGLAGRVHELKQAVERAGRGEVRATDADNAQDTVRHLREEVQGVARRDAAPERAVAAPTSPYTPPADDFTYDDVDDDAPAGRRLPARPLVLVGAAVAVLVLVGVLVFALGRSSDLEKGIEAFSQNRSGVAEQHFRSALERDENNATARLYLARILRQQGRHQEAAQQLRSAAAAAPRDAAVRRELGYLFMDLQRAQQAAEQFRLAAELAPTEPMNWVGLYEALVKAGDPRAEQVLRQAPADAQAMIRTRTGR